MVKINNTLLLTGLAFLQGIEAVHAFASTLQRVKNSFTNKEYTREELKIGIAGFYDRSSKLWEDVWGEVRKSMLVRIVLPATMIKQFWLVCLLDVAHVFTSIYSICTMDTTFLKTEQTMYKPKLI
jgi:hypothetical protein